MKHILQEPRKRLVICIGSGVFIIALLLLGIWIYERSLNKEAGTQTDNGEEALAEAGYDLTSEDTFSASGEVSYATQSEYLTMSFSSGSKTAYLEVEEVLASSGESVTEGQEIYKITEDSLEAAEALLEAAVEDAQNDYETALREYSEGMISANTTYATQVNTGALAETVYASAIKKINSSLTSAYEQYQQDLEIIAAYPALIEEMKAQLETLTAQMEALEAQQTDTEETESTRAEESDMALEGETEESGETDAQTQALFSAYEEAETECDRLSYMIEYLTEYYGADTQDGTEEITDGEAAEAEIAAYFAAQTEALLAELQEQLEEAQKVLEQAKQAYEQAVSQQTEASQTADAEEQTSGSGSDSMDAAAEQQELTQEIEELTREIQQYEQELEEAQNNAESDRLNYEELLLSSVEEELAAQNTYDESQFTATYAEFVYGLTVRSLETALQEAKDALTEAEEALEAFEEAFADGYYKAGQDGTIYGLGYEAEDVMTTSGVAVVYYDFSDITTTVSVEQEDVVNISVGDTVVIYSSGSGVLTGTVSQIAQESASSSVSYVTFEVVISIDNGASLSNGASVAVYFGLNWEQQSSEGVKQQ